MDLTLTFLVQGVMAPEEILHAIDSNAPVTAPDEVDDEQGTSRPYALWHVLSKGPLDY